MQVIFTHENADFDALASLLAASKLYPEAIPVLPRRLNRNLRRFLALYGDELPFVRADDLPRQPIEQVILVDTQTVSILKDLVEGARVRIIDHHPLSRELEPGMTFCGEEIGATTTLLIERICEAGLPLSPIEATLLLLGIYEDTGSLSYPTTTPRDLRCAAWLLERGANLSVVKGFLHYPLADEQRQLYNQLLENSRTYEFAGQSVVIATATTSGYVEEISTLAHKLGDLFEPAAIFLLVKMDDRIQLVARSTSDTVDVAQIASRFDGGGHSRAAAALIRGQSLAQARNKLVELLREHVRPAVTVGQIMSRGVHTLSPDTTVAEAEEAMRRYGHEGFPVVEGGRIVGVLTRREIDKALHHGLGGDPIRLYMHKGEIAVSPQDSVERLQQVMVEHNLGQIPVVEDGEIVGIVTRTDLIKLWSAPPPHTRREEIAKLIEEALPAPLVDLLKEAGQLASEMGFSLYAVGGFVRDLLLGLPNLDIDLVVEGDAIALARRLARQVGGRVRSHARFGTAKLILEGREEELGVPFLDFTTARTEFYEHPTALPQVERSSIKQDLYRRDFTINTMAICLDKERYGQLLDFYGGERDLKRGLIRVLHNLSFIEDPTRILRAVRLEQRLGFKIEERTEELIGGALDLLKRTTGERIRHELELILREREPERCLRRLDELGVLAHIHPYLKCDDWLCERFRRLRELSEAESRELEAGVQLALLAFPLTAGEVEELIARLQLPGKEAKILRQVCELKAVLPELEERRRPSAIYRLLKPFSEEAVLVHRAVTDSELVGEQLDLYRRRLRYVKPEIDGEYLKAIGLKPGPLFGRILNALRDARLDGEVTSLEEERALVEKMLAKTA